MGDRDGKESIRGLDQKGGSRVFFKEGHPCRETKTDRSDMDKGKVPELPWEYLTWMPSVMESIIPLS